MLSVSVIKAQTLNPSSKWYWYSVSYRYLNVKLRHCKSSVSKHQIHIVILLGTAWKTRPWKVLCQSTWGFSFNPIYIKFIQYVIYCCLKKLHVSSKPSAPNHIYYRAAHLPWYKYQHLGVRWLSQTLWCLNRKRPTTIPRQNLISPSNLWTIWAPSRLTRC